MQRHHFLLLRTVVDVAHSVGLLDGVVSFPLLPDEGTLSRLGKLKAGEHDVSVVSDVRGAASSDSPP